MKRFVLLAFALAAGCSEPAKIPAPPATTLSVIVPPVPEALGLPEGKMGTVGLPLKTFVIGKSPSPGVAYYEVQQATNIFGGTFFDLTNTVALIFTVALTNGSGTLRCAAVSAQGYRSTWTYWSLAHK